VPAKALSRLKLSGELAKVDSADEAGTEDEHLNFSWTSLIDPISRDQFERDFFAQKPIHLKNRRFPTTGLETIDGWHGVLGGQPSRVERHRTFIDIDPSVDPSAPVAPEIRALLEAGGPLIINKIDAIHPVIRAMSDEIAKGLSARTGVNAYISPHRKDAQDLHADDHEVVVLQLHGTKRWTIGSSIAQGMVASNLFKIDHEPLKKHARDHDSFKAVDLNPGDLLYLPRGMFHQATSLGPSSIHLTFSGLRPTGLDFAEVVLKRLISDFRTRDYFPPVHEDGEEAEIRAHMDYMKEKFEAMSQDEGVRRSFIDLYRENSRLVRRSEDNEQG
jgi:bifunctional lysine-specific demethylase and histidyl-hydroxylase MINA